MCLKGCVILLTLPIFLPGCPTENGPPFSSRQPSSRFPGPVLCKNMKKTYYWPCKTNRSESRRRFQRFYYEKKLVGKKGKPGVVGGEKLFSFVLQKPPSSFPLSSSPAFLYGLPSFFYRHVERKGRRGERRQQVILGRERGRGKRKRKTMSKNSPIHWS